MILKSTNYLAFYRNLQVFRCLLSVYSQSVLFEPERCFFPNCASQINLLVTLLTGAFPLSFSLILSLISSRFDFRVVYVENKNNNANTSCRTRERGGLEIKPLTHISSPLAVLLSLLIWIAGKYATHRHSSHVQKEKTLSSLLVLSCN